MIEDNDFSLVDDGTLDTVFQCNHCGTMHRFGPAEPMSAADLADDWPESHEDWIDYYRDTLETEGCDCHDDN